MFVSMFGGVHECLIALLVVVCSLIYWTAQGTLSSKTECAACFPSHRAMQLPCHPVRFLVKPDKPLIWLPEEGSPGR